VAKTLQPSHIVELGTCAGASGHAYLCGAPQAKFTGYDLFGTHDENVWNPLGIAKKLLATVSSNFTLIKEDLRNMRQIPKADMVVVDGAHDFYNAYSDLILAFTADPEYIWVDDYHGREVAEAVGWAGMYRAYDWWQAIEYCDGGMLIRMRK
jgi:predicted O-methyltransferase YrrM